MIFFFFLIIGHVVGPLSLLSWVFEWKVNSCALTRCIDFSSLLIHFLFPTECAQAQGLWVLTVPVFLLKGILDRISCHRVTFFCFTWVGRMRLTPIPECIHCSESRLCSMTSSRIFQRALHIDSLLDAINLQIFQFLFGFAFESPNS